MMLWAFQLLIFLMVSSQAKAYAFKSSVLYKQTAIYLSDIESPPSDKGPEFTRWLNEDYTKDYIEDLWKKHESLITIGAKGFKDSHINSISELLSQHEVVRVKLANTKYMDPIEVSRLIADSGKLKDTAELLEVRKKEFMFGRAKGISGGSTKATSRTKEKHCSICESNGKPLEMIKNHRTENCFDNPNNVNQRTKFSKKID